MGIDLITTERILRSQNPRANVAGPLGSRLRGNLMTCRVYNLTRRPVSLRGNSGQSWHLPPRVSLELIDAEVTENPKIVKLVAHGVIAVRHEEGAMPHEESGDHASRAPERSRRSKSPREGDA
jgi:hypothetical protein